MTTTTAAETCKRLTLRSPGNKPVYLLEELKALGKIPDYTFIPVSFGKNEQKSDWFEAVNPNGRIPALLDNREGKKPIKVWESASILLYIAKTYDTDATFHFKDEDLQTELLNWIFFMCVNSPFASPCRMRKLTPLCASSR